MYRHVMRLVEWLNKHQQKPVQAAWMVQVHARGIVESAGTEWELRLRLLGYSVSEMELNPAHFGDATARRVRVICGIWAQGRIVEPRSTHISTSIAGAVGDIEGCGHPAHRAVLEVRGDRILHEVGREHEVGRDSAREGESPIFADGIMQETRNAEVRAMEPGKIKWEVVQVEHRPLTGAVVIGKYYEGGQVYPTGKQRWIFHQLFPLGSVTQLELPLIQMQRGGKRLAVEIKTVQLQQVYNLTNAQMQCIEGECIELVMSAVHEVIPGATAREIVRAVARGINESKSEEARVKMNKQAHQNRNQSKASDRSRNDNMSNSNMFSNNKNTGKIQAVEHTLADCTCPVVQIEAAEPIGCYGRGKDVEYEMICPMQTTVTDGEIQAAEGSVINEREIAETQRREKSQWWKYAQTKQRRTTAQDKLGGEMTEELTGLVIKEQELLIEIPANERGEVSHMLMSDRGNRIC